MKKNTKIITVAVIILVCSLLSGCQESSQKAKDTKKQNIIADKQKENSKVEETTQNENIREGEAKDDNDLTGTYVDEESGETLKVVVKDGKASFCLYSKDGEEYSDFKEKDRDIKDNYIDGEMSYVSKNMDGSLAVSSGSGGSWGKFVKKEKGAKIDFTNILWIYRMKKYYNFSEDKIEKSIIDINYALKKNQILLLVKAKNIEELNEILKKTVYSNIATDDIYELECNMKKYLHGLYIKNFKSNLLSINCIYSYLNLVELENKDIISIIEAVRYGIDKEKLLKKLIN